MAATSYLFTQSTHASCYFRRISPIEVRLDAASTLAANILTI